MMLLSQGKIERPKLCFQYSQASGIRHGRQFATFRKQKQKLIMAYHGTKSFSSIQKTKTAAQNGIFTEQRVLAVLKYLLGHSVPHHEGILYADIHIICQRPNHKYYKHGGKYKLHIVDYPKWRHYQCWTSQEIIVTLTTATTSIISLICLVAVGQMSNPARPYLSEFDFLRRCR